MNHSIKFLISAACALVYTMGSAEIPAGYYDSCEGKSGEALLKALNAKISSHKDVGYDGLWEVYKTSDIHPDGTVWDMYSTKNWGTNYSKCGNYKNVGDCINREHSFPKSWFSKGSPMKSDAFHVYPTDGKVNGQRSNYPYGECANGTQLPANGNVQPLGRLGTSTFSGYSGKVFEPDDEYKGDLARTYFYMAACYNEKIANWSSDMLAGNSFPAYKTWAVNLLLKWTRQDEVSEKEIERNDAVYAFQNNRNPFIDHPEMAEHIWGNKQNIPWSATATKEPEITVPANGSEINIGYAAAGIARTYVITVRGANLTENVRLSATGSFSVSPATLSPTQVNNGATATITVLSDYEGTAEGVLTITHGTITSRIDLSAEIIDGLPVTISNVSSDAFSINWVNLDTPAADYTVHVKQASQYLPGYPVTVLSSKETYMVTGLDPLTQYSVQVSTPTSSSDVHTVTTADLVPSIQLLFDGELEFFAAPGEPSEIAELLIDAENISEDIAISVAAPFEVSSDKAGWARTITLDAEEDRFYMRVNSASSGEFTTAITFTAGNYVYDDAEATATVAPVTEFLETWEVEEADDLGSYATNTIHGTACTWSVLGGFWPSQDKSYNGTTVLRCHKNGTGYAMMTEDKTGGMGTVTFDAAPFGSDPAPVIVVEYSKDQGSTWIEAETVNIDRDGMATYTATVNASGNLRLRLRQISGKRSLLDNIGISNYSGVGAVQEYEYHAWDAFCRDGALTIENPEAPIQVAAYGMDGITYINDTLPAGTHSFKLPKGLYVVASGDFSRRVLVK